MPNSRYLEYFSLEKLNSFPELKALKGVEQDSKWHPEGDAFNHTIQVIENAKIIIEREKLNEESSFVLLLSALCHDFGKAKATKVIDGKIISHGHEKISAEICENFLNQFSLNELSKVKIIKLVANHFAPIELYNTEHIRNERLSDKALIRLIERIKPANIEELVMLSEADYFGKNNGLPSSINSEYNAGIWLLARIKAINSKSRLK